MLTIIHSEQTVGVHLVPMAERVRRVKVLHAFGEPPRFGRNQADCGGGVTSLP
ncbi:hypothetical protein ACFWWM_34880 [Streptomyces sp. NPDC058682]|uniref:hypothetical protein n=1 Tax=Streptomyces sp. NPDC058682 TaxID=3346596 RepID=UPI00364DBF35